MKILCVLYDDPISGMPESYARDDLPKLDKYPDGMSLPSPSSVDFIPGQLLGCVSGELGLRKFLEDAGHTLVVTSDKDGEGCTADKELVVFKAIAEAIEGAKQGHASLGHVTICDDVNSVFAHPDILSCTLTIDS